MFVQEGIDTAVDAEGHISTLWRDLRSLDQILSAEETGALRRLDVTITQYIAMMGLSYSLGQSSAHMARCLGVTPQAAHSLLRRLESLGFIQRAHDQHSDAVKVNTLTEGGRKVTDQADATLREIEKRREERLAPETSRRLLDILAKVVHLSTIAGTQDQVAAQEKLKEVVRSRLGASIRHLSSHHSSNVVNALKDLGLTASQYFVLEALPPGEQKTTSQIVSDASVPQQSGSSAVLALDREGTIVSSPSSHHMGLSLRSLTPEGVRVRRTSIERATRVEKELLEPLDQDEEQEMSHLLKKAIQVLG